MLSSHASWVAVAETIVEHIDFNIKTQPLESELRGFTHQTSIQVVFPSDRATEHSIHLSVIGKLSSANALPGLLADTGLESEFANANTIERHTARVPKMECCLCRDG